MQIASNPGALMEASARALPRGAPGIRRWPRLARSASGMHGRRDDAGGPQRNRVGRSAPTSGPALQVLMWLAMWALIRASVAFAAAEMGANMVMRCAPRSRKRVCAGPATATAPCF